MPDADEGFAPLPVLTEPPDVDEELRLQDALAEPTMVASESAPPAPLGRAPAYDFAEHRLLPGGSGGPLMTRGIATLATWVEKCLRTRRGENPACDPEFGCDLLAEDLLGEGMPADPSAIAEYLDGVGRALTAHPRISDVDFDLEESTFGQDDDAAYLTFTVVLDGDDDALTFERIAVGG